jgi:hypothetical protein
MLRIAMVIVTKSHKAKCRYTKHLYTTRRYTKRRYAKRRYAKRRYAECRGVTVSTWMAFIGGSFPLEKSRWGDTDPF